MRRKDQFAKPRQRPATREEDEQWNPHDGGPALNGHKSRLQVTWLDTATRKSVEWLYQDRIPLGSLTLLHGDGGCGKSTITLAWAAAITTGADWFDMPKSLTGPSDVLLLACEDSIECTILPRFEEAGGDPSRLGVVRASQHRDEDGNEITAAVRLDRDMHLLSELLTERPTIRLVIIDPLNSYTPGTDTHRDADVRSILTPLAELAERHHVAVLMLLHDNKGEAKRAKMKFSGSIAYINASRAAFWFTEDPEEEGRCYIFHTKHNLAKRTPPLSYRLENVGGLPVARWDQDPITVTADDVLKAQNEKGKDGTKADKCAEWLRKRLVSGETVWSDDLKDEARKAGFTFDCYKRAKDLAGVQSEKEPGKANGKWFCYLPKNTAF